MGLLRFRFCPVWGDLYGCCLFLNIGYSRFILFICYILHQSVSCFFGVLFVFWCVPNFCSIPPVVRLLEKSMFLNQSPSLFRISLAGYFMTYITFFSQPPLPSDCASNFTRSNSLDSIMVIYSAFILLTSSFISKWLSYAGIFDNHNSLFFHGIKPKHVIRHFFWVHKPDLLGLGRFLCFLFSAAF